MPLCLGLERLITDQSALLTGQRFAIVMNRASVEARMRLACDVLAERFPGQLVSILSPQHGLWCEQQANMVETAHGWHRGLGIPVHSLYSDTRRPTEAMLADIDCLVIDLQDVGTRVYTFVWTMLYCLYECAARGVRVIVLDRPNPIGGGVVEGPLLDLSCRSFVGEAAIPMRHGLTPGELAHLFNRTHRIGADLTVVPMTGWSRSMWFEQTGRVWVPTSPNMPTVETAAVYPGQVLLEGVNLSEGRGTTTPFEVVGAPFIDPESLYAALSAMELAGVAFLPLRFTPSFDKWAGQSCGGVSIHVTDRAAFRSYELTVRLLDWCRRQYPGDFRFNPPPYEYEHRLAPIDIISGGSILRETIDGGRDLLTAYDVDAVAWWESVDQNLLY